ncbi:TNF receptor-associated factor 5-like [Tubulanus polymorphus]|uniref:TNF receptor-associated factor 5-like n=1 Tax=Tubulanus polymorphus TaxID=672921 RepID=UPI003DA31D9B
MGLDKDLFLGEIPDDLICSICDKVFAEPVANCCPHVFCSSCIRRRLKLKTSRFCPICETPLNAKPSQPPEEFKSKLLSLKLRCVNRCGSVHPLSALADHLATDCPNAQLECGNRIRGCLLKIKRKDFDAHGHTCSFRIVNCDVCGMRTLYCDLFTHQKRKNCLSQRLRCDVSEGRRLTSASVRRHYQDLTAAQNQVKKSEKNYWEKRVRTADFYSGRRRPISRPLTTWSQETLPIGDWGERPDTARTFLTSRPGTRDASEIAERPLTKPMTSSLQKCTRCCKTVQNGDLEKRTCFYHCGPVRKIKYVYSKI